MVHFLWIAATLLSGTVKPAPNPVSAWQIAFVQGRKDEWISTVRALGRDDYFVAGSWGVTRSTNGKVERRESPGHALYGLVEDGSGGAFAVGAGELVLHFDGRAWNEEHIGAVPHGRQASADALLNSLFQRKDERSEVAFGPRLLLQRAADHSWTSLAKTDGERLMEIAQGGPPEAWRSAKCGAYSWLWTAKDAGWAACRDGRTFIFDGETVRMTGKKPSKCPLVARVATGRGVAYVSCSNATLWSAGAEGWHQLDSPADRKETISLSFADGCLFVATVDKVWRRCELSDARR